VHFQHLFTAKRARRRPLGAAQRQVARIRYAALGLAERYDSLTGIEKSLRPYVSDTVTFDPITSSPCLPMASEDGMTGHHDKPPLG
jgi:hypothetical protein